MRGRVLTAVAVIGVVLSACTASPSSKPHALAVRADGVLDASAVDLSGVAGVSPAEQHRAERLLRDTIRTLPKWSNVNVAKADGFVSATPDREVRDEHYVHWDWINDSHVLDPHYPESLVYRVT